jgi:S-adenosylmethionine-diacylgycerolhomoserine-N-methlytransferase
MKTFCADLKTLYHLLLKPARGKKHAERMESFYAGQAAAYDSFRDRLLPGRRELYRALPVPRDGVWVDLGGGTGANFESLAERRKELRSVYIVDLSASLLSVAEERIQRCDWTNVRAVRADATEFRPLEGEADVVTFSYALTMIPDWFAAIENARAMLKPGGFIGVADFYVSRRHPARGSARHSWLSRSFWPAWFAGDDVFLSADHLPFLRRHFDQMSCMEGTSKLPYVPLLRVPYYTFVGRKRFPALAARESCRPVQTPANVKNQ